MAFSFEKSTRTILGAAAILAATVGVPSYAQDKRPIKIGLILTYKGVYAPVSGF